MKIKFINAKNLDRNLKASVHKTGKIGFTTESAEKLQLSSSTHLTFGINEEDVNDNNLYVVVTNEKNPEGFPSLKAGGYYYVNVKPLLKELKIDFDNPDFYYEIYKDKIEGHDMFVFKHTKKKNKKEAAD